MTSELRQPYLSAGLVTLWLLPPIILVCLGLTHVPEEKTWLDAVSALLGPLVAYSAGALAFMNYKLSAKRREDDLFDRRLTIFARYRTFRSELQSAVRGRLLEDFSSASEYASSRGDRFPNSIDQALSYIILLEDIYDTNQLVVIDQQGRVNGVNLFIGAVRLEAEEIAENLAIDAALLIDIGFQRRLREFQGKLRSLKEILDFIDTESKRDVWLEKLALK